MSLMYAETKLLKNNSLRLLTGGSDSVAIGHTTPARESMKGNLPMDGDGRMDWDTCIYQNLRGGFLSEGRLWRYIVMKDR